MACMQHCLITNESWHQDYHCVRVNIKNYIIQIPRFKIMTCLEITDHKSTDGLWSSNLIFKYKQRGAQDTRKKADKSVLYSVMTLHPIYIRL